MNRWMHGCRLFEISTLDHWVEVLYLVIDAPITPGDQPLEKGESWLLEQARVLGHRGEQRLGSGGVTLQRAVQDHLSRHGAPRMGEQAAFLLRELES